jgi:hypothetical protein
MRCNSDWIPAFAGMTNKEFWPLAGGAGEDAPSPRPSPAGRGSRWFPLWSVERATNPQDALLAADRKGIQMRADWDAGRWDMRPGCAVGAGSWGGSAAGGVLRRVPVRSRRLRSGVLAGGQIAGSRSPPGMPLRPPESRLYATHGGDPLPMYYRGCKVA